LIHKQISIREALRIPKAKASLTKEWDKLWKQKFVDLSTVRPRQQVKDSGKPAHFGDVMELCHQKHAELKRAAEDEEFKARVVFRGDQTKDETGFLAVFSEQGTSASHMAAAKFLDAIAKMPDMDGEDADAMSAYTQVILEGPGSLGAKYGHVETWVRLPPSQQPASWRNIDDPVVLLRINLYGHPRAGFYWEMFCHAIIKDAGFRSIPGWECMWYHKQEQLFLSVYVDDFKMAGKAKSIPKMWTKLNEKLKLDPATKMDQNLYLGCKQTNITPTTASVLDQGMFVSELQSPNQEKIESSPQGKTPNNSSYSPGAPSQREVHHEGG
jgi:hypothetical protein